MSRLFLDLHVLQSLPPSNVNRDETGSPKTAYFGGVRRARVSSQAWKRAIRLSFNENLDASEIGVRSKRLVAKIAERILELHPELEATSDEDRVRADKLATGVLGVLGIKIEKPKRGKKDEDTEDDASPESGYLIFLSNLQVENLAEYAVQQEVNGEKPTKREAAAIADRDHSFDIALFGRMVADLTDLKVDAAAQVAHALSVHAVENEFDYFTAVDDNATEDHAGAGMIGTVEFNSSTLYRYATVNIDQLAEHLGDPAATARAVRAFTDAFVTSLPTGKQNTFANRTLPHAVVAVLRTDQPVNLVSAFETSIEVPPQAAGQSRLGQAAAALVKHAQKVDEVYDAAPERTWVLTAHDDVESLSTLGESVTVTGLLDGVEEAASERVPA